MSSIGFIGLGNMGAHMARNLIKKGHSLVVYDVMPKSVNELKAEGATVGSSPADVAGQCSSIVTMLPSNPQVEEVYFGSKGILQSITQSTLCMDSSTISPNVAVEVAKRTHGKGAVYMDAPVSGGIMAARDGNLTFMVGGEESQFSRAEPILAKMGKSVVYCGEVGTGQAAKICNNMLLAICMIGTSETYNLGIKLGLKPDLLAKIINSSSGRNWSSDTYNPVPGVIPGVPSSNNYAGGFGTALMTKDLGLAQTAATQVQSPTPLGSLAHQMYRMLCQQGHGDKDFSIVYKVLSEPHEADGPQG